MYLNGQDNNNAYISRFSYSVCLVLEQIATLLIFSIQVHSMYIATATFMIMITVKQGTVARYNISNCINNL